MLTQDACPPDLKVKLKLRLQHPGGRVPLSQSLGVCLQTAPRGWISWSRHAPTDAVATGRLRDLVEGPDRGDEAQESVPA